MEQFANPEMDGPFRGMAANSRLDLAPGYMSFLQNFVVRDGELAGRRGLNPMASALPDKVQGICHWQMLNGTQYTIVFANGDMYYYSWALDTFTQIDLSAADVTLSTTGDVNTCVNRGRLVFTDGINKPVMATGPVATIAFTTLTNAPIAHRCGVYYDKVFFWDIPDYENEFQWSDEGDPENGYVAEDQAWEFAQTDAGRILGMAPLNERNIILKEDSATMLMGSVDEEFQTLAVREGLSETEGAVAGGSVIIYQGDAYCLSANGPRRIRSGQVYESMHESEGMDYIRDYWSTLNKNQLSKSLGWHDPVTGHLGWLVPVGSSSDLCDSLVYNTRDGSWSVFKFEGFNLTAVGTVESDTGEEWVIFGDEDGQVYKYRADAAKYSDDDVPIELIARSRLMGGQQTHVEKRLVEVMLQLYLDTDFVGELRSYIDGETGNGLRFGIVDVTGKKRYRRGFNASGYRVGWELYAKLADQTVTISRAVAFFSLVGLYADWKNG